MKNISLKHRLIIPVALLGIVALLSNLLSFINIHNVNASAANIADNYMEGKTAMDIIKEMQKQYGIDKRHAMLIARDQTAKLNAAITQHQQQEAGIESYTWSTSWDDRVRDSHRKLDGKPFRWDDPPETEKGRKCHPGQDYQCRCCAIPIINIDKLELPV